MLPWVSNALYLVGIPPFAHLDPTPLTMTVTACLCAWALFRFGLMDLIPAARDVVIEQLNIGILVADSRGRLVDANPAAAALLGFRAPALLGRPLDEALGVAAALREGRCRPAKEGREQVIVSGGAHPLSLEVRRAPLHTPTGHVGGEVVTVVDISDRHRIQQEREALIAELQRTLAEVRTLGGLLPICAHCKRIRDDEGYWTRLEEYISSTRAPSSPGICPGLSAQAASRVGARGGGVIARRGTPLAVAGRHTPQPMPEGALALTTRCRATRPRCSGRTRRVPSGRRGPP